MPRRPEGPRVVVMDPGKDARVEEIRRASELKDLQGFVGGYIERVASFPYQDTLWYEVYANEMPNEEAAPNRVVEGNLIRGPLVVCMIDRASGESIDMDIAMIVGTVKLEARWERI